MKISELAADHHYHLGIVFPDKRFSAKELKRLAPKMDAAGLDYGRSSFGPNDAIFESSSPESPEKTIYRVTSKFLAITHHFVGQMQFEAFCKLAETYIPLVSDTLQVPPWRTRECIVQKLAPCPDGEDSRNFLSKTLLRLDESKLGSFEKPPQGLGLRFVFPAEKTNPTEIEVKVESYLLDTSRLFLQAHARYHQPLPRREAKLAVANLRETKEFLEKRVFPFVES
ncbi:MAG: hypothetical protein O7H41_14805 [Planctomycetota bacterium]|nr:hypothetical protein [Planctomycetota bacterium]